MRQILITLLLLLYISGYSFSQEMKIYKIVNSNQLVVGSDTFKVGVSMLKDLLTKSQIDSLDPPIGLDEVSDDYQRPYFSHVIKRKDYDLTYYFPHDFKSLTGYVLESIRLKNFSDNIVSLGDSLQLNCMNDSILSRLKYYRKDKVYPNYSIKTNDSLCRDSISCFQKVGVSFNIYKNESDIQLLSVFLHRKEWDYYIDDLEGYVLDDNEQGIGGALVLAYSEEDSLKGFGISNSKGKFWFQIKGFKLLEILRLGYEPFKQDYHLSKRVAMKYFLKPKIYSAPNLNVFKSGKIEVDSSFDISQFPQLRDVSKIDHRLLFFDQIMLKIGCPKNGFLKYYQNFINNLDFRRYPKDKEIFIWFTVDKEGEVSLDKITGDEDLINDKVARAFLQSGSWETFRTRGRASNVKLKMKLTFN